MSKVQVISTEEFGGQVEETTGTVVVDFTASWCPPCKMLAPVFEKVAEKFDGQAKFFKVDVDESVEVAAKYGVSTIPNLLFFKNGQVVDQSVGFVPENALSDKVENALKI
jgi:thioredoxin 1